PSRPTPPNFAVNPQILASPIMLLHAEKWRNWTTLVPPEIPEPIRRELRIANNMLDVLVSHPRLDGRRIDAQSFQRPRIENYRPVLSSRMNSAIWLSNCCCIATPPLPARWPETGRTEI